MKKESRLPIQPPQIAAEMDFSFAFHRRELQLMKEQVFWPITASFLVLVGVFFLAIDASQNGDLTQWLSQSFDRAGTLTDAGIVNTGVSTNPDSTKESGPALETLSDRGVRPEVAGASNSATVAVALAKFPRPATPQSDALQTSASRPVEAALPAVAESVAQRPLTDPAPEPVALVPLHQESAPIQSNEEPASSIPAAPQLQPVPPPLTLVPLADQPLFEDDLPTFRGSRIDPNENEGGDKQGPDENTALDPAPAGRPKATTPLTPLPMATPQKLPDANTASSPAPGSATVGRINTSTSEPDSNRDEPATAGPWPVSESLTEQVALAGQYNTTENWAASTLQALEMFGSLTAIDDPLVETLLEQLANQINELDRLVVATSTCPVQTSDQAAGPQAARLRALNHQLIQYWSLSGAAYRMAVLSPAQVAKPGHIPVIQASTARFQLPHIDQDWDAYLTIDELQAAILETPGNAKTRRRAAQRFLTRLTSPMLNDSQKQLLGGKFDQATIDLIRDMAFDPVDLQETLGQIDLWRQSGHGYYAAHLASTMQGLSWQDDENSRALADTIDQQLRAANLRISVSDEMLNRLLPAQPEVSEPVHENMLGSEIHGHSRIANRLQIRLIPDPHQIQLRLEAFGRVRSQTAASAKGFVVDNVGDSEFRVFKRLIIGRAGILSDRPLADARTSSQVVGMKSRYDSMPIVGWVARRMASRQIAEQTPQANRMVEQKLQTEVTGRFEEQIDAHLYDLQDYLSSALIQPLSALELEPTPIEMRSTDDRIIMQYRMAGRDQLAAGSARPMGQQNSLMSMQVHESLINNVLGRIDLAGQTFTGAGLSEHLAQVFGQQAAASDQAATRDFQLEFASYDPVAIHLNDGAAVVELNIRALKVGKGKTWRNLIVQATYVPVVEGSRLRMVQDMSGISLKGSRLSFRDQAALRAIFTAMFRGEYEISLIPEGITQRLNSPLVMNQFDLADGWLAMSVDLAGSRQSLTPPADRPNSQQSQIPVINLHR